MTRLSDCRTAAEVRRDEIRRHPVRYLFWSAALYLEDVQGRLVHWAHARRHPALHAECCSLCARPEGEDAP